MPFLRFLLCLILGILFGKIFPNYSFSIYLSLFFLLSSVIFCFLSCKKNGYKYNNCFGLSICIFFFTLGEIFYKNEEKKIWNIHSGKGDLLIAYLEEDATIKNSSVMCSVIVNGDIIKKDSLKDVHLQLYVARDSLSEQLKSGDVIAFPDNLFRKQNNKISEFDFEEYLHIKGYSGSVYIPQKKWSKIGEVNVFSLKSISRKIQLHLIDKLKRNGIDGEEFGLLSAMVLGDKSFMDKDLRDSYTNTGTAHVLAVSGLHIGAVCYILSIILGLIFRTQKSEPLKIIILILLLWIYAFVTGLSPSVVRASFMITLFSVARIFNRKTNVYNIIFASAFFMLIYNPFYIFDIGFQLSYLAVLSIVYFQPIIYNAVKCKNIIIDKIWALFTVSIAAQFGTMPISIYYFHTFSCFFWLTGIIVVFLSSFAIYFSMILFLLPNIQYISNFLGKIIEITAYSMNYVVKEIDSFSLGYISIISVNELWLVLTYTFVFFFGLYFITKKISHLGISMILLTLSLVSLSVSKIIHKDKSYFIVYNMRGTSVINTFGNGENILYYDKNEKEITKKMINFWSKNYASNPKYYNFDKGLVWKNNTILYIDKKNFSGISKGEKLKVDYLIIGKDVDYRMDYLQSIINYKTLIFDSSNSWKYLNFKKKECENLNIKYYDVTRDGTFITEL